MSFADDLEALRLLMIEQADERIKQIRDLDQTLFQCDAAVMRELQAVLSRLDGRRADVRSAVLTLAERIGPVALPPPDSLPKIIGGRRE